MEEDSKGTDLSNVIRIDDERVRDHLGRIVRGTVEETLNAMLEAALRAHGGAAGSALWKLRSQAADQGGRGDAEGSEAAPASVRDGNHRALSSTGEFGGGSADRDVLGRRVGAARRRHHRGTVGHAGKPWHRVQSQQEDLRQIEAWRNQPIEGDQPYLYLDGIVLKRSWAGEVRNVSLLVAISVNGEGYRQILGIVEGAKEDKAGWSAFLGHLRERGLTGVELIVSDACMGLVESAAEFFPEARWQRCMVHFYRNVFSHVPAGKLREVALMLKAIHAQEDLSAAQRKAAEVIARLHGMRLGKASELVETAVPETLAYYAFPQEHWRRIRTTDEIDKRFCFRRGSFPCASDLVAKRGATAGRRRQVLYSCLAGLRRSRIFAFAGLVVHRATKRV
jgi:putative transposase